LIIWLYFRQVDPTINEAPRHLSEDIQQRNIRKVKVNAQVAFAIYILETIGIFSMLLIWFFFGKTEFARTASTLLYYVLLPYIYLLNTSNNKDRITDEGWWSTVRYALGMPNKNVTEIHSQAQEETFNMQTHRTKANHSKKYVSSIERTNATMGQVDGNKQKSGIYTVSYNKNKTQTFEFDTQSFISEVKACSSNGTSKPSRKQHEVNHLNLPDSGESDDDSSTSQGSRYLHLAGKILFEMRMNIDKEEVYIHYLKQLLVLDKETILDDFKILEINSPPTQKHGKVKTTKQNARLRGNSDELEKSKNQKKPTVELNIQFLGRHLDRLDLRKGLLENSQDHCKDDKTYKIFFNKIFDFEESLLMEHHKS
jgi:hypothetical protein